jgi:salicylate hydroxylase
MLSAFSNWSPNVHTLLSTLPPNPFAFALFHHAPARTYVNGRICIMGDAAHATTPHLGAGAGQAVEDAYVLGSLLLSEIKTVDDIEKVFRAYEFVRIERSQKVVAESEFVGRLWDKEVPEFEADYASIGAKFDAILEWVWNEDVAGEVDRAKEWLSKNI